MTLVSRCVLAFPSLFAVLREKPWVPRRVGTRKLKVEEIFALMKADICKSEPFRLLFEDISVQQMRSHFHHMMGYHLNETNKKEESARSDETQPEGEEAKLVRKWAWL